LLNDWLQSRMFRNLQLSFLLGHEVRLVDVKENAQAVADAKTKLVASTKVISR
jgi:hypothetical protein